LRAAALMRSSADMLLVLLIAI
jgi:hypothetical protein